MAIPADAEAAFDFDGFTRGRSPPVSLCLESFRSLSSRPRCKTDLENGEGSWFPKSAKSAGPGAPGFFGLDAMDLNPGQFGLAVAVFDLGEPTVDEFRVDGRA